MKIGILGLGSIGTRHAENLIDMGERNVMVFDPAHATDELYGYKHVGIPCLRSVQDFWAGQPEVVLICTPPATHHELVTQALDHGCHVFCEKPLATNYLHAKDLAWCNDNRQMLTVGYQLLACPSVQSFPKGWRYLHIWDRQNMSAWPKASYARDILQEYSHELSLALFWAGSYPATATAEWSGASVCIELTWDDGRTVMITLQADAQSYDRGAKSDKGEWQFSQQDNDIAYRQEIRAFLLRKPFCSSVHAVEVVRLLEQLC